MQSAKFFSYKITDPAIYSHHPTRFFHTLRRSRSATLTVLRDKSNPKLKKIAKRFRAHQPFGVLNHNFKLARRLGFGAIHFTQDQLAIAKRFRRAGYCTFYSAHDRKQLRQAARYRIDFVTLSPIFPSPNKGAPLGVRYLRRAKRLHPRIIALGGILHRRQIFAVQRAGACAFASIRAFV